MTVVRELITLLGFTVDNASYQKAARAYDTMQGKLTTQTTAQKAASAATKEAAAATTKAAQGTNLLGNAMGMLQRFVATAGISALLKQYTTLASDANETQGALKQLFGESGLAQAEAWSKRQGEAMGRSEYDLQSYAARLGSVLGPMTKTKEEAQAMAQRFSELAVDLGSFFNTTDQDAMQALRSGITGEYESLKRYGVVLNDTTLQEVAKQRGIKKKLTQMSQVEKTELRYHAILARTTAATGDAIRTGEGFANSSKALAAQLKTLGINAAKRVVPVFEKLVKWSKEALKEFDKMTQGSHVLEAAFWTLTAVAAALSLSMVSAFILPALAIGALILLVDELWTTFEGGDTLIRDWIDGFAGAGTTAEIVENIKVGIEEIQAAMKGLDARAVWDIFAAGVSNVALMVELLIDKMIDLAGWTNPIEAARRIALIAAGKMPERKSITQQIAEQQSRQSQTILAGVHVRDQERAERERTRKYGARVYPVTPEMDFTAEPTIPFAGGMGYAPTPTVAAPAAPAAGGGAPASVVVNNAAPIININGGDPAALKRAATEVLDARDKKTQAAYGGRGRK